VTRRRSEDCPSNLKLDRWLAGESMADEQRAVAAHVEACERCQQRHAELAESRQSFAREAPPFAAIERPASGLPKRALSPSTPSERVISNRRRLAGGPAHRQRSHWLLGASALAAAAAIAFAVGKPWPSSDVSTLEEEGPGARTKGGVASLGWVVLRNGHVFAGRADQPVRAGDAVRFTVSAREPVYVTVLGLDASGRLSVYYPEGEQLSKLEPGRDQLLPTAIEWDATAGAEQLYGVFCRSVMALSPVREAIQRSPDAPALPPGCSIEHWTLPKESP
jgi:anti-sigma factor RsiW